MFRAHEIKPPKRISESLTKCINKKIMLDKINEKIIISQTFYNPDDIHKVEEKFKRILNENQFLESCACRVEKNYENNRNTIIKTYYTQNSFIDDLDNILKYNQQSNDELEQSIPFVYIPIVLFVISTIYCLFNYSITDSIFIGFSSVVLYYLSLFGLY